ncbi:MAG: hypothetical protein IPP74_14655 [Alphaproteobacteria bacterium]|nr:hypothetical protein [Alphaproteobacteria bacterium]
MIKPLNKFVQIEPEAHEEFVTSQRSTYDEIGIVIEIDDDLSVPIKKGSRVFLIHGWTPSFLKVMERTTG